MLVAILTLRDIPYAPQETVRAAMQVESQNI